MNTRTFTVTVDAKIDGNPNPNAKGFTIDIGSAKDYAEDLSAEKVNALMWGAWKVEIQGQLRKCKTAECMQTLLVKKGFTDCIVTEGIERTESVNKELKALEAILGKDKVAELLREELAKRTQVA